MNSNPNMLHTHDVCKCLSWKAVIAGALVAVGLSFLLNLFSVAIGLSAFTTGSKGVQTLVFGGLLGTAIGTLAAMFAAGWLTGYIAQQGSHHRHMGALYGFLAWCVALIMMVLLAGYMQQYVTVYGNFLSGTDAVHLTAVSGNGVVTAATTVQEKSVVISTYIVFALFFLSALSSSLGGHCGMTHTCKKEGTCC